MPVVFLGTVEIADPDDDGIRTMFKIQSVRIHVDEAFKGVSGGQTVELHQGGTDCDAKFRTGEPAVFYLYPGNTPGTWALPWCSRSVGSAEPHGDDLLFLKGLPKSAVGTRLSGEVKLFEIPPKRALNGSGGIPDVRVKISGSSGSAQVVTNDTGVYEVFGLRPGRYSVKIDVPRGLKIWIPVVTGSEEDKSDKAAVVLAPNGAASVDFLLQADTRLSGRVLDPNGAPIGSVCIDLQPVEGSGESGGRFFGCSQRNGRFEITMVPPGKYLLVARDEVRVGLLKSKSTLYYPGVRDRDKAVPVLLEASNYLEHVDLRLPSNEKRYKIAGRFQYADGAPVSGAQVNFTAQQQGYSETSETGPDGLFTLPVIAGMEGQLTALLGVFEPVLKSCPEFKVRPDAAGLMRFMDAYPISVSANTDHEDLKLELSSPSCKSWPLSRK